MEAAMRIGGEAAKGIMNEERIFCVKEELANEVFFCFFWLVCLVSMSMTIQQCSC